MKRFVTILVLFFAVYVAALSVHWNVPLEYTVAPPQYAHRLLLAFKGVPLVDDSDFTFDNFVGSAPTDGYIDGATGDMGVGGGSDDGVTILNASADGGLQYLSLSNPTYTDLSLSWNDVTSISDFATNIKSWFASLIENIRAFFSNFGTTFQRIWYNAQVYFHKMFEKMTATFGKLYNTLVERRKVKNRGMVVFMAAIPLDWQRMAEDNVPINDIYWYKYYDEFAAVVGLEWRDYGGHRGGR